MTLGWVVLRFFVPTHLALSPVPDRRLCAEMRNVCALIDHEDDAAKIYHVRIAASPQISFIWRFDAKG